MEKFNVNCQKWKLAESDKDAKTGAEDLFKYINDTVKSAKPTVADKIPKEVVVKAQIHAGGRGKGHFNTGFKGGVHVCKT
jgi:succinyl-CoA synthetase beta subunit